MPAINLKTVSHCWINESPLYQHRDKPSILFLLREITGKDNSFFFKFPLYLQVWHPVASFDFPLQQVVGLGWGCAREREWDQTWVGDKFAFLKYPLMSRLLGVEHDRFFGRGRGQTGTSAGKKINREEKSSIDWVSWGIRKEFASCPCIFFSLPLIRLS